MSFSFGIVTGFPFHIIHFHVIIHFTLVHIMKIFLPDKIHPHYLVLHKFKTQRSTVCAGSAFMSNVHSLKFVQCSKRRLKKILLTNYRVLKHGTETGMRICRSQYLQDKLGQKINKQGVLIREGVGKIEKLINGESFY